MSPQRLVRESKPTASPKGKRRSDPRTRQAAPSVPQRLVRESNPSHFMDSEAATPVASRSKLTKSCPPGSRESNLIASLQRRRAQVRNPNASPPPSAGGVAYGDRTRLRRFTVDPRPRRETPPQQLGAERAREHAAPVDCRGVAPRSSGFQPDAITGLAHNPNRNLKPESALGGTRTLHRLGESQTSCLFRRRERRSGGRDRTSACPVNNRVLYR